MTRNRLKILSTLGQSVWLDYLDRRLLEDGDLSRLIEDDGLSGVTTNPTIFDKALSSTRYYAADIEQLTAAGNDAPGIVETLMRQDVARAADLLKAVHDKSQGSDGLVSIEVSPHLAHDADGTVTEAEYLWAALNRTNVMIKVPATREGLDAIRRLTAEGISVNATLLFSVRRYREVAEAYLTGLKERAKAGKPITAISSVASFFLSRIDTLVDRRLDRSRKSGAASLRGLAAIACAKLAYREYVKQWDETVWQQLTALGARPQRLLWASTSTKDPSYSDIRYVDSLIAASTVNTMTLETLAAYRRHGEPKVRIQEDLEEAETLPAQLATFGIDLDQIADELEEEGVRRFAESHESLRRRLRQVIDQHEPVRA
jgi:transaldolase